MPNYYYLAISLPPLKFGAPPEVPFHEFETLLKENLSKADYAKITQIRWFYDIQNIRAFWKGEEFDHWGNLNVNALEEDLLTREGALPSYVYAFLDEHETLAERLKYFPFLFIKFFQDTAAQASGFLKKYAEFERNLRLTITAYRARQLGRDLAKELQFEDPEDTIVAQLLAQKDAKIFEPPIGFEDLKPILEEHYDSPIDLQKALFEYSFNKLEQALGGDTFSIDYILLYTTAYIMVDKWYRLDKQKGLEIIDNLAKGIA